MSDSPVRTGNILLGVSGSISAYKAAELASQLTRRGHRVTAILTSGAEQFITALTLQTLTRQPVVTSLWEERDSNRPGHIELADAADLLLIAPATASVLAKLAHGFADDVLGAIALATLAPVLVAPAMNGKMWQHPATQANVATLRARAVHFIGPDAGMLACGYEGVGRLWPVDGILAEAEKILATP